LLLQHEAGALTAGDVLRIGEYEIAVSVAPDALTQTGAPPLDFNPFAAEPASLPVAVPPMGDKPSCALQAEVPPLEFNPFGMESALPSGVAPEPWSAPLEPFPLPPKTSMPAGESFLGQPDVSPFHESFLPPEPAAVNGEAPPVPPHFDAGELLRELDWHDGEPPQPSAASWEPPEDLLKDLIPEAPAAGPFQPDFSSAAPAEPVGSVPPRQEPASPAPDAAGAPDLFACFLEGAGLASRDWVRDEELPEVMKMAGALLRDFVVGMMAVLRARSEMKSQLRVLVTTMRAQENNPLKFTVTPDDALKLMLTRYHPGFMDPVKAVRGGFDDLVNHQMATNAGIQAALAAALKRFDPQGFEKLHEDAFIQKKAKCWDAFCKAYPGLVSDTMENFFGEEFADVYERQMHRLQSTESQ
jgi:type VI secretion system protein